MSEKRTTLSDTSFIAPPGSLPPAIGQPEGAQRHRTDKVNTAVRRDGLQDPLLPLQASLEEKPCCTVAVCRGCFSVWGKFVPHWENFCRVTKAEG